MKRGREIHLGTFLRHQDLVQNLPQAESKLLFILVFFFFFSFSSFGVRQCGQQASPRVYIDDDNVESV